MHCIAGFVAVLAVLCAGPLRSTSADGLAQPTFTPGQSQEVALDGVGGGRIRIFVPSDYDPAQPTPVIVNYHGLNGQPTTQPFERNLGGRSFLIVGMSYFERGLNKRSRAETKAYVQREVAAIRVALTYLDEQLNIDPDRLFLSGVSKGGWHVSAYGEASTDLWAGLLILIAGRNDRDRAAPNPRGLRGLPIYIGVGETDGNNKAGKRAAAFYTRHGADVVFTEYAGRGHQTDPDCEQMRAFLLRHGPLRGAAQALDEAREAEKAGRPGEAYVIFDRIGRVRDDHEVCQAATASAHAIAEQAEAALAAADEQVAEQDYVDAIRAYIALTRTHRGSPFGERADAALQALRDDPERAAQIEQMQLNQRAHALEQQARAAEQDEQWARALTLWQRYLDTFADAERFEEVRPHAEKLVNDPAVQARARTQAAAADCREWLSMADNLIAVDRPEPARGYLERILEKHPDTDWAVQARERLGKLEDED